MIQAVNVVHSTAQPLFDEDTLFWSNADGWVGLDSATHFTDVERLTLNLPLDGEWLTIYQK